MSRKMKPIILDDNVHIEHPNDIKEWIDDTKYWPSITYGDIYKYLIDSKTVDGKAMKGWKIMESRTYFLSGWVVSDLC